jgi:histone deacetylase complex regulatory component SIN3
LKALHGQNHKNPSAAPDSQLKDIIISREKKTTHHNIMTHLCCDVKRVFGGRPRVYNDFLEIMKKNQE